jgi:type I restriction enzyme M protein
LIFLRFADSAFTKVEAKLKGKATGRRTIGKTDYQAKGVVYIPDEARFSRGSCTCRNPPTSARSSMRP